MKLFQNHDKLEAFLKIKIPLLALFLRAATNIAIQTNSLLQRRLPRSIRLASTYARPVEMTKWEHQSSYYTRTLKTNCLTFLKQPGRSLTQWILKMKNMYRQSQLKYYKIGIPYPYLKLLVTKSNVFSLIDIVSSSITIEDFGTTDSRSWWREFWLISPWIIASIESYIVFEMYIRCQLAGYSGIKPIIPLQLTVKKYSHGHIRDQMPKKNVGLHLLFCPQFEMKSALNSRKCILWVSSVHEIHTSFLMYSNDCAVSGDLKLKSFCIRFAFRSNTLLDDRVE